MADEIRGLDLSFDGTIGCTEFGCPFAFEVKAYVFLWCLITGICPWSYGIDVLYSWPLLRLARNSVYLCCEEVALWFLCYSVISSFCVFECVIFPETALWAFTRLVRWWEVGLFITESAIEIKLQADSLRIWGGSTFLRLCALFYRAFFSYINVLSWSGLRDPGSGEVLRFWASPAYFRWFLAKTSETFCVNAKAFLFSEFDSMFLIIILCFIGNNNNWKSKIKLNWKTLFLSMLKIWILKHE